jgi:hypothetical protein
MMEERLAGNMLIIGSDIAETVTNFLLFMVAEFDTSCAGKLKKITESSPINNPV